MSIVVYPTDSGEFVVSDEHGWLPGCYVTDAAARRAGTDFSYEDLLNLQNLKNDEAGGKGGKIACEDLDRLEAIEQKSHVRP